MQEIHQLLLRKPGHEMHSSSTVCLWAYDPTLATWYLLSGSRLSCMAVCMSSDLIS